MKKYKFYILAVISAVILTVLQILIARTAVQKEIGFIYITVNSIAKGDILQPEDYEKIEISGYDMQFQFNEGLIAITDLPQGSVISNEYFIEETVNKGTLLISLTTDKSRCPIAYIEANEKINMFIMPDKKSLTIYESAWLDSFLENQSIAYDQDNDIGFMISGITIKKIAGLENANQSITIQVEPPIDRLLAFLKTRCIIEFIIPYQY
jgi:hypothetical protein